MIRRYRYGDPVRTDAIREQVPLTDGAPSPFRAERTEQGVRLSLKLARGEIVYGLGESARGINKRGWVYESWNTDDPHISEARSSLYGSHNFLLLSGERTFGVFVDCGERVVFDVGYSERDELTITAENFDLWILEGGGEREIVSQFRRLIGQSYIPPRWAFGYGQSRWGYRCEEDIRAVADGYREAGLPLDMIYLDIDYMDGFRDFTIDASRFPDFAAFVKEMKARGIRLVPIIDAAVKAEEGYSVYDEGVARGYFCKDGQGEPFVVGVWPGDSVLPDVLNPAARAWFGSGYKMLLDCGIEGFWNDMNEPATFYGRKRLDETLEKISALRGGDPLNVYRETAGSVDALKNNGEDYASFYHETEEGRIRHDRVHNLYGYYMTRAAAEYFAEYAPDRRYLLFSRSSYIGMHRYGGIWTGDNASRWRHILLNLQMLPSLNMCGFLFVGADLGGFGENTTEDLLLRWLALGVFVPLMRNHSALGTREQECYRFGSREAFRGILRLRYALIPYLYSEYVKCALRGEMLFRPLAFDYPEDARARGVEDQLLFGGSLMIAPVYEQNASGRYVYLPERMKPVRLRDGRLAEEEPLEKGDHFLTVPPEEVVFFLREGCALPLAKPAENLESTDLSDLDWICFSDGAVSYELCEDDGESRSGVGSGMRTVLVKGVRT